ncbi:SAM-dependent methyltransferase [Actinoalloteichus spitiensis]|uniref:SAM-dependent methyltransferase n=1 Tax=Actinoalloteichus spitiensis TaxID=252394 RepID=UPI00035FB20B|nr:SAM-dependent methyltransferase [Actinoalloteichus spitiensis]
MSADIDTEVSMEQGPPGVDVSQPNPARMYDYALGGAHNFAVDRDAFDRLAEIDPDAPLVGRTNRAFLRRAVRYCLGRGVRQFLDLGSGIPTEGNVHEIAQTAAPDARVVYVDNEPVAVSHTRQILRGNDLADIVPADMRDVREVLAAPETRRQLDLDQPVALMMVAVLHYVSDQDDPAAVIAAYREHLPPGSVLVLSHTTSDQANPELVAELERLFSDSPNPVTHRTEAEVRALLAGTQLVDPGLVWTPLWRPDGRELLDDEPHRSGTYAAVAEL